MKNRSSINPSNKRISINRMIKVLISSFIILGFCVFINTGLSIYASADDVSGSIDAEQLTNSYTLNLTDDATLDVSGLTHSVSNLYAQLNNHTLTITGNSQYTLNFNSIGNNVGGNTGTNGNLVVNGGNITVTNIIDINNFTINDGSFGWECAFHVTNNVNISGGTLNSAGTFGDVGMEAYNDITVSGGTITITGRDGGLIAHHNLSISGGTINIDVASQSNDVCGISGGNSVTISGGNIDIATVYSGNSGLYSADAITSFTSNIDIQANLVEVTPADFEIAGFTLTGSTPYYGLKNPDGSRITTISIRPRTNFGGPRTNFGGNNGAANTVNKSGSPKVQEPPHVHSYAWEVIQSPTAESDGYEAYRCSRCGDIKEISPLPAFSVFDTEVINKIKNAPLGGTVKIETTHWNTLGRSIRDALVSRPDVTVSISFLSEGHKGIPLKVTLPAGADITGMFDENGYLGLCRAGTALGYDQ